MHSLIFAICTSILVLGISAVAYAEPGEKSWAGYPYVDPIREYYDARQAEFGISHPPATVYYNSFTFNIGKVIECGWNEITGQVPYSGLVLISLTQNSDLVYTQNINSNPDQLLRGWINIPCSAEPANYTIKMQWLETPFEINGLDMISYMRDEISYEILVK